MVKKLTTEDFIARSIASHEKDKYDYSESEYVKATVKVRIYCNTCQEFFYQSPSEHMSGSGCKACGIVKRNNTQRLTTAEFLDRALSAHSDPSYDYSEVNYVSFHSKIKIICPKHNTYFLQTPATHLSGKTGCKLCKNEKMPHKNRSTTQIFIEEATKIWGDSFNYELVDYVNNRTKIKLLCNKHNELFDQTPMGHLSGKNGCSCCKKEVENPNKKDLTHFLSRAVGLYGDRFGYDLVEYESVHSKVKIKCKEHDLVFEQTPANHYFFPLSCPLCLKQHKIKSHPLKITKEVFTERSRMLFGDFYDYSLVDLSGSRENRKVTIICPEHGPVEQDMYSHLSGIRTGCCLNRDRTTESFIKEVVEMYGDIFDFSETEYKGSNTKITLGCKQHGKFYPTPGSLLQGHSCPSCADYGFNPAKNAVLYVHKITNGTHTFTGFGITRNIVSRTRNHVLNLKRVGYSIGDTFVTDELIGSSIQDLETTLMCQFPIDVNTSSIIGFKTESTTAPYKDVVAFCTNYIEENYGSY